MRVGHQDCDDIQSASSKNVCKSVVGITDSNRVSISQGGMARTPLRAANGSASGGGGGGGVSRSSTGSAGTVRSSNSTTPR